MTRDEFLKLSREVVMAHVHAGAKELDPEVQRALGVLERAVDGAAPDRKAIMSSMLEARAISKLQMMKDRKDHGKLNGVKKK